MKLEFVEVKDRGTPEERIVLNVVEDCNLMNYMVFSTKRIVDKIDRNVQNTYWLPTQIVKKGDLVVLYSKKGVNSLKENADKTTSYFYYRGFISPILLDLNLVLVVELNTWSVESF